MLPTRLYLIKPDVRKTVARKQSVMREKRHSQLGTFAPGDTVSVRDYRKNDDRWTTGTVVEQTGPVSYRVEVVCSRYAYMLWRTFNSN